MYNIMVIIIVYIMCDFAYRVISFQRSPRSRFVYSAPVVGKRAAVSVALTRERVQPDAGGHYVLQFEPVEETPRVLNRYLSITYK